MSIAIRSRLVAFGLGLTVMVTGCAGAPHSDVPSVSADEGFPVSVQNCGRTVTMRQKPHRAITLNQGATEQILALGLETQTVGTAYLEDKIDPKYEAAYNTIPVLATEYPSKEVLLATKPDLLLASFNAYSDRHVGTAEELEQAGIASYLNPFACAVKNDRLPASFDNVWSSLSDIGTLFGRADHAAEVINTQRTQLDSVKQANSGSGKKIFWWDSETNTPHVGANAGGPQLIMEAVGATNAAADVEGNWGDMPWEKVVAADPDVIVLADSPFSSAQTKIDFITNAPTLQNMRAVKDRRFVTIPFSQSTTGATLVDGAKTVSDQLTKLPTQ